MGCDSQFNCIIPTILSINFQIFSHINNGIIIKNTHIKLISMDLVINKHISIKKNQAKKYVSHAQPLVVIISREHYALLREACNPIIQHLFLTRAYFTDITE